MATTEHDRLKQLAKLLTRSGLRAALAASRRSGAVSAEMVDILTEIARSADQDRDRRAAAKSIVDIALGAGKLGIEERRLQLAEKIAEGGAGDMIPPLPEFVDDEEPDG